MNRLIYCTWLTPNVREFPNNFDVDFRYLFLAFAKAPVKSGIKRTRRNKLVEPEGREYRGLLRRSCKLCLFKLLKGGVNKLCLSVELRVRNLSYSDRSSTASSRAARFFKYKGSYPLSYRRKYITNYSSNRI